jgi:prophage tail gpP-like protein
MRRVVEAQLELRTVRCPRCAGELVIRVSAEERGRSVFLTLDTACASCGVSPWSEPDERTVVFTPGAPIEQAPGEEAVARLAAAQTRIDALLRRVDSLEATLAGAHRNLERAEQRHRGEQEAVLRTEISRLEGALAEARAEVRKAEEATRGIVSPGKRPIEME